jgi:dihydroorotase-like cyclic amidohydrolase
VYDLLLRDATIVSSTGRIVADVAVAEGRIAYVGPRPPRAAREEIPAIGKFLIPGVIDTAVQFDPNGDPRTWERESRAAVTGGITTVVSLPHGDRPVVDRASARRRARQATGSSWVDFALWGRATEDNAGELALAVREGLIVGTLSELEPLARHLDTPGVLAVQLDDPDPRSTSDMLALVRTLSRALHLVHLSTAAELHLIDPVRGDLPLTAGCTPHHLFLSTDDPDAIRVHTRPPVRAENDRRSLWTAVKRGRLDCIASDHHPLPPTSGDGVPGAELLLPLMLSAVRYGRLSLELLVSLCSESPARIFGLERKGRLAKGADADLVLFSERELTRVAPEDLLSGAGWSPYTDREAAPKPDLVLLGGVVVAQRGQVVQAEPAGRQLTAEGATRPSP